MVLDDPIVLNMFGTFNLLLVAAWTIVVLGTALDTDRFKHQQLNHLRPPRVPLDNFCASVETDDEYDHCLDELRTYFNTSSMSSSSSGQEPLPQANKQGNIDII